MVVPMMMEEEDRKRKRSERWEVNKASLDASIGGRSRRCFARGWKGSHDERATQLLNELELPRKNCSIYIPTLEL